MYINPYNYNPSKPPQTPIDGRGPARLTGSIAYSTTGNFALSAHLDSMTVGHLAQFFTPDIRDDAMSLLQHLSIDYLDLQYEYASGDGAGGSRFLFEGSLSLDVLSLGLRFEHTGTGWSFEAKLGPSSLVTSDVTIETLLKSLFKDDLPDMPGAVGDIVLTKPGDDEVVGFKACAVPSADKKSKLVVLTATIHIASVSLTYIQWRDTAWPSKTPAKRIIKVAVNEIGPVKAPLVGELKQPFAQLVYLWVVDKATATLGGKGKKLKPGITKGELDALHREPLKHERERLFYKPNKEELADEDVVILPGSHFMVVAKDGMGLQSAVLDYVFGRPKKEKAPKPKGVLGEEADEMEENKDVDKSAFKLSVGPLTFENIGLQWIQKEKRLGVVLDATFLMGPIGLALLGFCLSPKVDLAGLIVSFDKDPLTVAGGFMHTRMEGGDYYAGGLIIAFKPWMIQAVGVYGNAPSKLPPAPPPASQGLVVEIPRNFDSTDDTPKTFTMVFIIFKLEGPLFSVGFADISGLTGGVGVNSNIRLPTASSVLDFPFVKPKGTETTDGPLAALRGLLQPPTPNTEPWFSAREGSFWIAAGLKATAFQMLTVDAVVVVQLDPDVQLGIFGVAVCSVPSLHSPVKFAHAELGIACTLDIKSGVFKLEAQLSPRSFVLHPSCHLTGGMALYAWFGEANDLAGDWVLTIGGFHQAFNKPPQYPRPPRLGISWALGPALRIRGEAYFAITPRVCMGGGRLYAALTIGALSAWFDAFIDLLINYRPFYFSAVGSISVGVRFSMDLWLVTVRISAEIGATLTVAGPPMAGTVHVDFWVFGFDIDFGDKSGMARPDRMELGAFKELALKSASAGGAGLAMDWVGVDVQGEEEEEDRSAAKETTKPFLFNCVQGLVPESEVPNGSPNAAASLWRAGKDKDMWVVRGGGLSFTITLSFAASEGEFKDDRESAVVKKKEIPIADIHKTIYAQPMCLTESITSKVTVTVSQSEDDAVMLRSVAEKRKDDQWSVEPIIKSVPRSVWGKYDPEQDPMLKGNNVRGLLGGATSGAEIGTIPLVMGLTITPPAPYKSKDRIPKFNLVEDIKLTVNGKGYPFPDTITTASDMWAPRAPIKDKDPWDDVKNKWADERNRPEDVVKMWAKRLRFEDGSLSGKRPAALLRRFETMVPALPMVARGTGRV
ncbi:hypothetical protein B0T19DRAFT_361934 [Cercophora scortea]|uniref:DUF6603 domain-containing protein n=1 Tax=Cercophora scortea TaxID=314031 RepID=A0AAE0I806_9PEZI|nr:hypothetical protein B0T19DRAFT_361934 [Cercophora scortea]